MPAAPSTQILILGAGIDGRAAHAGGSRSEVFEVDIQHAGRTNAAQRSQMTPAIGAVTFVSIGLRAREQLGSRDSPGRTHDPRDCGSGRRRMYLTHDAMRATVAGVAERSAPGSTLIVTTTAEHRGGSPS